MQLINYLKKQKLWTVGNIADLSGFIRKAMDELPQTATKEDITNWLIKEDETDHN